LAADIQPNRVTLDRAMTEDELLQAILEAATFLGYRCHHDRRSDKALQQGHAGFPDVVLARSGTVWFLELKAQRGVVSYEQGAWRRAIMGNFQSDFQSEQFVRYRLVRPEHLDTLLEELAVR